MLETEIIDDLIVVWLKETDRLNAPIAEPVKEGLLELFNKPGNRVIFDLRGIKFIDSSDVMGTQGVRTKLIDNLKLEILLGIFVLFIKYIIF